MYSTDDRSNSFLSDSSPEEARHGTKRRKEETFQKDGSSEQTSPESNNSVPPESVEKPASNGTIESRLDRLTSLVEALSRGKAPESFEPSYPDFGIRQEKNNRPTKPSLASYKSQDNGPSLLAPVASRSSHGPGEDRSRNPSAERALKSPVYDFDIPTASSTDLSDPMGNLNLGYLSIQEGGRSRYIGSTFWAYVSDELDQLNLLLRDQNRYVGAHGIGNKQCQDAEAQDGSSFSEESHESLQHNSFHTAGDEDHHQKSQLRSNCPACQKSAFDKGMLLQMIDSHPSRFRRMDFDMLSGIPTETQSHILFRCWLSGVHGHCPMVHPPTVLEKYGQFWDWYNHGRGNGLPMPDPHCLPLLYAIWYAGSVSISIRGLREFFKGTKRAKLSAGFHDQVARGLALNGFPRVASLPDLAAFLMLQIIVAKEEEPLTASLFVGLALRVAQTLGLHRDPALFNFEPWEVEVRRRVWWHIVQGDVAVAIASGLPPLIHDGFWDVKLVSEIKDVMLGTPEAEEYEVAVSSGKRPRDKIDEPTARKRTSIVSVHYVTARAKMIASYAVQRLLRIHLGTKSMTRQNMEEIKRILGDLQHDLNATIKRIPTKGIPEYGFTPGHSENGESLMANFDPAMAKPPSEEDLRPFLGMGPSEGLYDNTLQYHWNTLVAFHKFSRILLSLLIDKVYCIAYQPFLKNAKSKLWASARQCALRHCHGFMRKFISLATDPAFQPFQWCWPGNHQPMHATMIMLVDLYERPESVEAPKSRAFIDKIFSLSGPDGGIVSGEDGVTVQRPLREGGREAWDMLRRLRDKAWQRAGLDPTVLWTEEDQIQAGVARPLSEAEEIAQSLREDSVRVSSPRAASNGSAAPSSERQSSEQQGNSLSDGIHSPENLRMVSSSSKDLQIGTPATNGTFTRQQPVPFQMSVRAPSISSDRAPIFGNKPMTSQSNLGDVSERQIGAANNPVPPMASSNGYFNPPTTASLNSNRTDTNTKTTPSENAINDFRNAPSPSFNHPSNLFPPLTNQGSGQHFDWDQWDAVFGQHLPLDDAMEDVNWESQIVHHGDQQDDLADMFL